VKVCEQVAVPSLTEGRKHRGAYEWTAHIHIHTYTQRHMRTHTYTHTLFTHARPKVLQHTSPPAQQRPQRTQRVHAQHSPNAYCTQRILLKHPCLLLKHLFSFVSELMHSLLTGENRDDNDSLSIQKLLEPEYLCHTFFLAIAQQSG